MSLFPARLVFLAFIGLAGYITYNALYLQKPGPGLAAALDRVDASAQTQPAHPRLTHMAEVSKSAGPAHARVAVGPKVTGSLSRPPVQEASSALITALQRELDQRGYDAGGDTGIMTPKTHHAIVAYQKDHGLRATGEPSNDLLRRVVLGETLDELAESATPASVSMPHAMIKSVQKVLADLGYAPGPIDGVMGGQTKQAIIAFQRDRRMAQTGRISPKLLQEMERVSGERFAGGSRSRYQ